MIRGGQYIYYTLENNQDSSKFIFFTSDTSLNVVDTSLFNDFSYELFLKFDTGYNKNLSNSGDPGECIYVRVAESHRTDGNYDFHLNNKAFYFPSHEGESGDIRFLTLDGTPCPF